LAISAKRYTLFLMDNKGVPELLTEIKEDKKKLRNTGNNKEDRWSQHGLGHLSNPSDLESQDRDWISKIWLNITRKTLGLPAALKKAPLKLLVKMSPVSRRMLIDTRAGRSRPHRKYRELLTSILQELSLL
jgi:hypothetical protein